MATFTGDVIFQNGISVQSGGNTVLNQLLGDLIDQSKIMDDVRAVQKQYGFTNTKPLGQDVVFSQLVGPVELDPLTELGTKVEQDRAKLPNKGFKIKQFGGKYTTSKLMTKWIEQTTSIDGAAPEVLQGRATLKNNAYNLMIGAGMNIANEAAAIYTNAFIINSDYGPGSPTPKMKSLIATNHAVRNGTVTFRNTLTTANQVFAASSLQDALDTHKKELRRDNGYRIQSPKGAYIIKCSRANAVNVRKVLNSDNNRAGMFAGTGSNANLLNQFDFRGNKVEIVEMDRRGDVDKFGNLIASDDMWFVENPDTLSVTKSLKFINLYDPETKNYRNDDTGSYIVDLDMAFAIDHYGYEQAVVGSLGTVSI